MPFETAKAVAATFCYKIRFALTPLFGVDFPSQCVQPHDRAFGKMTIDPEIIKRATELSRRYCQMEFESKSIVHGQNYLMSPEDIARLPDAGAGVAWSEGNISAKNTFTPINLSRNHAGLPRLSPSAKILTSDTLPSIKEALGVESFEYLCANPLKRRLLNDVHIHEEQNVKVIPSRPLISMARLPVSLRKLCAEHGDDEDGFTDEVSLDDDASSFSSASDTYSTDSDSDAVSKPDVSSKCFILGRKNQLQHSKHTREDDRLRSKKRQTTKTLSRHHQPKQLLPPFSPPPTAPLSSSSASPTPVKHHHQKSKKHSRGDDLTAAETLLALRSGSSTLSESEDEGKFMANAKNKSRHSQQHHQKKHKAGARGDLERFSLAFNSQSDLIERMAKRLRRASF